MRQHPVSEQRQELVQSIKQFLDVQSAAAPVTRCCADCGLPLSYFQTQLWMEGVEQGWNIGLPYCAHCHPTQEMPAERIC